MTRRHDIRAAGMSNRAGSIVRASGESAPAALEARPAVVGAPGRRPLRWPASDRQRTIAPSRIRPLERRWPQRLDTRPVPRTRALLERIASGDHGATLRSRVGRRNAGATSEQVDEAFRRLVRALSVRAPGRARARSSCGCERRPIARSAPCGAERSENCSSTSPAPRSSRKANRQRLRSMSSSIARTTARRARRRRPVQRPRVRQDRPRNGDVARHGLSVFRRGCPVDVRPC
jgi:hypothetical protein